VIGAWRIKGRLIPLGGFKERKLRSRRTDAEQYKITYGSRKTEKFKNGAALQSNREKREEWVRLVLNKDPDREPINVVKQDQRLR